MGIAVHYVQHGWMRIHEPFTLPQLGSLSLCKLIECSTLSVDIHRDEGTATLPFSFSTRDPSYDLFKRGPVSHILRMTNTHPSILLKIDIFEITVSTRAAIMTYPFEMPT